MYGTERGILHGWDLRAQREVNSVCFAVSHFFVFSPAGHCTCCGTVGVDPERRPVSRALEYNGRRSGSVFIAGWDEPWFRGLVVGPAVGVGRYLIATALTCPLCLGVLTQGLALSAAYSSMAPLGAVPHCRHESAGCQIGVASEGAAGASDERPYLFHLCGRNGRSVGV